MVDPKAVRVTIDVERSNDTISGRLSTAGAEPSPFYGWLELIDHLEHAVGPDRERLPGESERDTQDRDA